MTGNPRLVPDIEPVEIPHDESVAGIAEAAAHDGIVEIFRARKVISKVLIDRHRFYQFLLHFFLVCLADPGKSALMKVMSVQLPKLVLCSRSCLSPWAWNLQKN